MLKKLHHVQLHYIASKLIGGKHKAKGISVLLLPAIESQKAPIHFKLGFIW